MAAGGSVVSGFDDVRNKGLDIGGKAGDPVYAAADGRVIHAGTGLRGYGNWSSSSTATPSSPPMHTIRRCW